MADEQAALQSVQEEETDWQVVYELAHVVHTRPGFPAEEAAAALRALHMAPFAQAAMGAQAVVAQPPP
ncbi:hypothetical protein HYH03_005873 [Edaphochlamys debaryana]|uniref:Uncharacterized protein n=1 Tax=Edaphochlamys debaryana TaxID=47281 RepID=A0A836C1J3_9CHLO|nr:hypothetical protein HYH03_005873 [Edaphochlamys debaryana]|eukprot:KAG2495942.1 hypothetical protein HYH03_005873 [Edaphochlamys debaryana]